MPLDYGVKEDVMENKDLNVKKVGPVVEMVWGLCLMTLSFALLFVGV